MSVNQIAFLVLDSVVFVMFVRMMIHSRQVEVETKVGNRWAVFGLFVLWVLDIIKDSSVTFNLVLFWYWAGCI